MLLLIVLVYLGGDRLGYAVYILYIYLLQRNPFFNLNSLIQTITLCNATSLAGSITSRVFFKTLLIYLLVS
jgi:hypothetical protein